MEGIREFQTIMKRDTTVYQPEQILDVLGEVRKYFRFSYKNKSLKYFNVPIAFDIETSNFYDNDNKVSIMYEWTLGIFGEVIIGRTWEEFISCMDYLTKVLQLNINKRIIIYVHNLSFEFQFLRKYFSWEKIFTVKPRTPVYALTKTGIEFRCSYLLSGYSLAKLAENVTILEIRKLKGDLDYRLKRHSKTVLNDNEIQYCINDVKIVMAYTVECIERDSGIAKIPLTKTGYVREFCRNTCFVNPDDQYQRMKYRAVISNLILSVPEYTLLKQAFQGGFTHANPWYVNTVVCDVESEDIISSYPCAMLEEYPMGRGEEINPETMTQREFLTNLKYYCCLFEIECFDIVSKYNIDNYISLSRCRGAVNAQVSNGRVVRADYFRTTITEQDFLIIRKTYKMKFRILKFYRYKKQYLPTEFVKAFLSLYKDKTELKGVNDKKAEYQNKKEMLNSCYGMTVTDICREVIGYNTDVNDWEEPKKGNPDIEIPKYNKNSGRFMFYAWGVWVTAYARRNLWSLILECKEDYIYSDTDSVKMNNAEKHRAFINDYNNRMKQALYNAMDAHGLPRDLVTPKNKKGDEKPLGIWEFDGKYSRFKTLGAKRYMTENAETGEISITVSGVNKEKAVPYLCDGWYYDLDRKEHNSPFDKFTDKLLIPAEYTGKLTHTYIDKERDGVLIDYLGVPGEYHEKTSVHLEESEYNLSMGEFLNYVESIKGGYIFR